MKWMDYELPLGISITQHAPDAVDDFVEKGFRYFEVGIPMVVESETLKPSGMEEARICIEFLKAQEK